MLVKPTEQCEDLVSNCLVSISSQGPSSVHAFNRDAWNPRCKALYTASFFQCQWALFATLLVNPTSTPNYSYFSTEETSSGRWSYLSKVNDWLQSLYSACREWSVLLGWVKRVNPELNTCNLALERVYKGKVISGREKEVCKGMKTWVIPYGWLVWLVWQEYGRHKV